MSRPYIKPSFLKPVCLTAKAIEGLIHTLPPQSTVLIVDAAGMGRHYVSEVKQAGLLPLAIFIRHEGYLPPHLKIELLKSREFFHGQAPVLELSAEEFYTMCAGLKPVALVAGSAPALSVLDEGARQAGLDYADPRTAPLRYQSASLLRASLRAGLAVHPFYEVHCAADVLPAMHECGNGPWLIRELCYTGRELTHAVGSLGEALELTERLLNKGSWPLAVSPALEEPLYALCVQKHAGRLELTGAWSYSLSPSLGLEYAALTLEEDPFSGRMQTLRAFAERVLEVMQLRHGPASIKIRMGAEGPALYEAAATLPEGFLPPGALDLCLGQHFSDSALRTLTRPREDETCPLNYWPLAHAVSLPLYNLTQQGRVRDIPLYALLKHLKSRAFFYVTVSIDDDLLPGFGIKGLLGEVMLVNSFAPELSYEKAALERLLKSAPNALVSTVKFSLPSLTLRSVRLSRTFEGGSLSDFIGFAAACRPAFGRSVVSLQGAESRDLLPLTLLLRALSYSIH